MTKVVTTHICWSCVVVSEAPIYAAFWLDPTAVDPNKRVVLCRPFVKKPATAWAILRSAIHSKRTGGILSGVEDDLVELVAAIDRVDQTWPTTPDLMVVRITELAKQHHSTVVFRQNIEPDGIGAQASVWMGLQVGAPYVQTESDLRSCVRFPLSGSPLEIETSLQVADRFGWSTDADQASCVVGGTRLTLQRFRTLNTRAALEIEYPVVATLNSKQNTMGYSEEYRFGYDDIGRLLDSMLGPTGKRYRFCLLIREPHQRSVVFFGNKRAQTLRQAVEHYMDHLHQEVGPNRSIDRSESSDSESAESIDPTSPKLPTPALSNCRFWKL